MDVSSYFSPKLTGGAHSSAGFAYQDLCGLICLFESLNRNEEVLSISVETINDFAIHHRHHTVTSQVKKQTLTIPYIKKLLQETHPVNKHTTMIVASHFNEDLDQLIKKRDQFRCAIASDLDEAWKKNIIQDFHNKLIKYSMGGLEDLFIKSEFRMIPESAVGDVLLATLWKWIEKQRLAINIPQLLDSLKSRMQLLRCERGYLSLEEIKQLVRAQSTESIASQVIREVYQLQFSNPSLILSVLGVTKEDILKPLEEKLLEAEDYFKSGKYSDALDIYLSLSRFYPKEEIYFQCAMLYEIIDEYEKAIEYCNMILDSNPNNYGANVVKGTSLGAINKYTEAITQLEKALSCRNTPEAHYNLGYTYWVAGDDKSKAIEHYRKCIQLDDSFAGAHLNISICYFEVMNYELSLSHINKALQLNPELYEAYERKGELYRFLGLYDDAIEYFQECLTRNKQNYQALLGISLCFSEKGYLSEAIIYFKSFFNYYYQNFFKQGDPIGKKIRFLDSGWEKTTCGTFELYSEGQLNVYINGTTLPIPLKVSKDFIFIGSYEISDKTGSILYPVIGKTFENVADYQEALAQINEAVSLVPYPGTLLYVNSNDNIQINLKEREEYVLVEIIFDLKYQIVGITDQRHGGLEAFIDYFEEYGQCRIHLECASHQMIFIIDGIKKVDVQMLPPIL